MPSGYTAPAWYTFTADTLADAAQVTNNFDLFRGHIIPIDASTGASDTGQNYTLGGPNHYWGKVYAAGIEANTGASSSPVWQKYTVQYSDINGATTTDSATLFTNPARGVIHAVAFQNLTQFEGGSVTGVKISVGTTATANKYALGTDVGTSAVNQIYNALAMDDFTATQAIIATFSATGSNLDSLTAGQIDVYVLRSQLPS